MCKNTSFLPKCSQCTSILTTPPPPSISLNVKFKGVYILPYCAHFGAGRVSCLNIEWKEFWSRDSIHLVFKNIISSRMEKSSNNSLISGLMYWFIRDLNNSSQPIVFIQGFLTCIGKA